MSNFNEVDILLVEDNPEDKELTMRALQKRNLVNRLHHVEDGAAALDFLFGRGQFAGRDVNTRPKVVLLDLKLPKVDGLEVLHAMREDPRTRDVPVVVITSSREDRDLAEAYRLGANSYVVKPVDFNQFSEAVGQLGLYWVLINEIPRAAGS